jgi:hypothetical protein
MPSRGRIVVVHDGVGYNCAYHFTEDYLTRIKNLDAIFAHDDYLAGGIIVAPKEAGVAPGKVEVVGIGDALKAIKERWMYGAVPQSPITETDFEARRAIEFLNKGKLDPFYKIMDNVKDRPEKRHQFQIGVSRHQGGGRLEPAALRLPFSPTRRRP